MGDVPRSVALKLGRVDTHMKTLDDSIKAFLKPKPYSAKRVLERDGRDHVLVWDDYVEPPDDFGLIAGDAIHNLRSSLDHMAVELAWTGAKGQGATMTAQDLTGVQFPIVLFEEEFAKQFGRRLKHVSPAAQAFIESCQPYRMTPKMPAWSNLYLLGELDNADKHRLLTTCGLAPGIIKDNWPMALSETPFRNPENWLPPERGSEIGRFTFAAPQREEDVPVDFKWGFTLLIGQMWHVHDIRFIIGNYIKTVRWIIDELSRNFVP
jgi:hypothetical protein